MPYGFPSGAQLRDRICRAVDGLTSPAHELITILGLDRTEVVDFARAFQRSYISSIDSFLLRRPEFGNLGKFAIAADLCTLEHPNTLDSAPGPENWYRFLWNKMVADTRKAGEILGNRVRFVSFNYDRSLERFLYVACKNTFGISDDEALKMVSSFGIMHVYGLLGKFHYAGVGVSRAYDNEATKRALEIAASGIRLIPAERGDDADFKLARAWMTEARRVCFLGFGFDPTNCANLGLADVLQSQRANGKELPSVFASTLGLTDREVDQARRLTLGADFGWTTTDTDNVMTLRIHGVLN
jgi:hypothetical protein